MRIQRRTSVGWAYVRRCVSSDSIGCAIVNKIGVYFQGSIIYFDYKGYNNSIAMNILMDGGIKFSYICKIDLKFDVNIKILRGYIKYNIYII